MRTLFSTVPSLDLGDSISTQCSVAWARAQTLHSSRGLPNPALQFATARLNRLCDQFSNLEQELVRIVCMAS